MTDYNLLDWKHMNEDEADQVLDSERKERAAVFVRREKDELVVEREVDVHDWQEREQDEREDLWEITENNFLNFLSWPVFAASITSLQSKNVLDPKKSKYFFLAFM